MRTVLNARMVAGGTLCYAGGYLAGLADHPTWYNYVGVALGSLGYAVLKVYERTRVAPTGSGR